MPLNELLRGKFVSFLEKLYNLLNSLITFLRSLNTSIGIGSLPSISVLYPHIQGLCRVFLSV